MSLKGFADVGLNEELLDVLLQEHALSRVPRLEMLWSYYRNPMRERASALDPAAGGRSMSARPYRLAQESGLPARLRGVRVSGLSEDGPSEKEIVIENDIAWRVEALVDFAFGKPVRIVSTARDAAKRAEIERVLDAAWEASGGAQFLQDMALLGLVHGHVDLILRSDALFDGSVRTGKRGGQGGLPGTGAAAVEAARSLRVELIAATRGVALVNPGDYRRIDAYVIRTEQETGVVERESAARRALAAVLGSRGALAGRRGTSEIVEIISAQRRMLRRDGTMVAAGANPLGVLPVVHIQNSSQPFRYSGLSDVEPLIPLQDELNTRLSDRAHRVTMQSFNMYLAKGFETGGALSIGPSRVLSTDNLDASIQAFGGDGESPSEEAHIEQLRDAMDKTSSVSPVAIGVIRERLGHLSSENALRITLAGVLSKTARKRLVYGRGIGEMCRLMLHALDVAGVYRTDESERGVRLDWPDPLPEAERDRLSAAKQKIELGVPRERVLSELGYGTADTGVA